MNDSNLNMILEILNNETKLSSDEIEAVVHALVDVKKSVDNVYGNLLPQLLNTQNSQDETWEVLQDISEEFKHVDYHIKDGHLTDL